MSDFPGSKSMLYISWDEPMCGVHPRLLCRGVHPGYLCVYMVCMCVFRGCMYRCTAQSTLKWAANNGMWGFSNENKKLIFRFAACLSHATAVIYTTRDLRCKRRRYTREKKKREEEGRMGLVALVREHTLETVVLAVGAAVLVPVVSTLIVLARWTYREYIVTRQIGLTTRGSGRAFVSAVEGKHVIVVGGTKGLGKETARILQGNGAYVTVIARGEKALKETVDELNVGPHRVLGLQGDCSRYDSVLAAFERSIVGRGGMLIDWVICTAGAAEPGLTIDQISLATSAEGTRSTSSTSKSSSNTNTNTNSTSAEGTSCEVKDSVRYMMDVNYMTTVNSCRSFISLFSRNGNNVAKGNVVSTKRVVIVGSVMSELSFAGYGSYSAAKFAQRAFFEALRQELLRTCHVTLFLPGNMDTPGFAAENAAKPQVTREIEGASALVNPLTAARSLLAATVLDPLMSPVSSNDVMGELIRVGTQGSTPRFCYYHCSLLFVAAGGFIAAVECAATPVINVILQIFTICVAEPLLTKLNPKTI